MTMAANMKIVELIEGVRNAWHYVYIIKLKKHVNVIYTIFQRWVH